MKKLIIFIPFLLTTNTYSQKFIGEKAENVLQAIEYMISNHNKVDYYGNSPNSIWSSDVDYNDGQIARVYLWYHNEAIINWGIVTDFCKIFVVQHDTIAYILTQYKELSIIQLKSFLGKQYPYDKKMNIYYVDDSTYYDKVYLGGNGLATIECRKAQAMGKDSAAFKKFKDDWHTEITDKKIQDSIIEVRNVEDEPFTLTNDTVKVLKKNKIYIHPLKPKYTIWSTHARILHEGVKRIDSLSNLVYYPRIVLLDSMLIQSIYQKLTEYVNANLKSTSGFGELSNSPEKGTYLFSIRIKPAWESVDSYHIIKTDKEATFEILFDRKLP